MTRPQTTVQRDQETLKTLASTARSLDDIVAALGSDRATVYGSIWRLKLAGHVEKVRVGSRIPVWQLTDSGADQLGVVRPAPVEEVIKSPS